MALQIPAAAVFAFFMGALSGGGRRRTNGATPSTGAGVAPAGYAPPPPPPPSPLAMAMQTIANQPAMQTPVMSPTQPVVASTQVPAMANAAADPLAHWAGPAVASIPISGPMAPPVSIPLETPPVAAPPAPRPIAASPTSQQTAQILAAYLNSGGSDRTSIANYQRALGITADGIAGPQTFATITAHGGGVVSAARMLSAYVNSGGRNTTTIASYQRMIGATADGIVGPNTAAMVAQQGGGSIVQTIVPHSAPPAPAPSLAQQPAPQMQTASLGQYGGQSTAQWAAGMLAQHFNAGGRDGNAIRGWQQQMGGITADGVVGPNTAARVRALGAAINYPPAAQPQAATPYPSHAAAVSDAQRSAALALAQYYNGGGRDRTAIRSWQQGMGGITADGVMGPNTRARAAALGASIH